MSRIFWSPAAVETLTNEYNKGTSDAAIAAMIGTTKAAVGRHRSILGLVAYKREGFHRKEKTVKTIGECKEHVIGYMDAAGAQHFIPVATNNPKIVAHTVMVKNGIKQVIIYQPVTKLVLNHLVEIPLT